MDPSPEYLTARLTEILFSLRADAERATLRHKNEILALQEVIEGKDREISELQEEVQSYRRAGAMGKAETASFKKITLGRRTPKNVSQFTSDLPTSSPQMTHSVLLDQKATHNNQSAKNVSHPHPHPQLKMENCQSVKLKQASNAHPAKNSANDKQNMKIIRKKPSIPNFHKNDRTASTMTTPLSKPKLTSSIKPLQRSQKRGESKQSKTSREKRCIDVLIPSVNFSSYSINAKGRQGE